MRRQHGRRIFKRVRGIPCWFVDILVCECTEYAAYLRRHERFSETARWLQSLRGRSVISPPVLDLKWAPQWLCDAHRRTTSQTARAADNGYKRLRLALGGGRRGEDPDTSGASSAKISLGRCWARVIRIPSGASSAAALRKLPMQCPGNTALPSLASLPDGMQTKC